MSENNKEEFTFKKQNYILIAGGTLLCVLGYILMSGGGSDDPAIFSEDLFSFRRITLSPLLILIGLAIVGWGIMKKVKD